MVAHAFSLAFIAVMTYFSWPGSSLFSWHPFLMTLGFIGFIFQAILVFSKESSLFASASHAKKVQMHWLLQVLGLLCVLVAYGVIYYSKELNAKVHLTTWHGLIGFITVVYTSTQVVAGHGLTIANKFVRPYISYGSLCMYHATSGTLLFVLACISITLGIFSNWFSNTTAWYIWYLAFSLTSFVGLIVANQVTNKYVREKQRPSSATTPRAATKKSK